MREVRGAVIIPTHNESERVLSVANAALWNQQVDEVIVVNDGSSDDTAELLDKFSGDFTVLTHPSNKGKGEALDTGVRYARNEGHSNVVLLDADLQGVESTHITALLLPFNNEEVPMVIGYLGLRKTVVKKAILNQWGALSGQRAIRSNVWDLLDPRDRHGFNIEAALNARLRKAGLHRNITRIALEGVGHVGKRVKEGKLAKGAPTIR